MLEAKNDQLNLNAVDFQLKFYENLASKLVMKVDLCCLWCNLAFILCYEVPVVENEVSLWC